ncbi:hypothetical protein C7212DRAFT_358326 [Tuber magnatum]|uniref:MATE efflux family protein n=1 Tax=Tuber magnatum TaxID=42249 RepID=A0A317SYB3_9PEZI|nr:hypothetical protein C7212DRAFT_358326 [Tuber magnatum]
MAESWIGGGGGGSSSSTYRHRYRALPDSEMSDNVENEMGKKGVNTSAVGDEGYPGALLFNISTFILPAIYATLSKLWIAQIDSKMVVTTDTWTYISTVTEVINEGLPRASFVIIGDRTSRTITSRIGISNTLIIFQAVLGTLMSVIIAGAAQRFTDTFVPVEVREESVTYVRISAFGSLFGAVDYAVSCATRALDRPDVPLLISTVKTALNIILDLLILSNVRVGHADVDVNTQAIIRLSCDSAGALAGVCYFMYEARKLWIHRPDGEVGSRKPSVLALVTLARQGWYTFLESCVRNVLYLWLISGIVAMGSDYATAWGVFNTIRWGLVMVPVQALEATSSTFVGHAWGVWRHKVGIDTRKPKASRRDIRMIMKPALISVGIALLIEVPLCFTMSLWGTQPFARWLSGSDSVAGITEYMWRTIDWCYIFYAVSTQLASILLATRPRWYLGQSLLSNLFWVLPWAIVVEVIELNKDTAWKWHAIVFGGSLVVSFVIILVVLGAWAWRLMSGRSRLSPVYLVER